MLVETPRTKRVLQMVAAPLIVTALTGALAAFSARAQAADQASGTYICRPAAASDTANAKMTDTSGTALECRPVSMTLKMSDGSMRVIGRASAKSRSGPDLSKALTPAQVNDAWVEWTEAMFNITHTP